MVRLFALLAVVAVGVACAPTAAPSPTTPPAKPTEKAAPPAAPKEVAPAKPTEAPKPAAKPTEKPAPKPAAAPRTISMALSRGLVSSPSWNLVNVAPKYGISMDMKVVVTYADQQRAVAAGEVNVATTGINNPAIILSNGITNLRFIAGQQWGGQNLIMRKGVDLRTWKDLEGKKIGVAPGTYTRVLFMIAARQKGVDLNRVDMVNVDAAGATALQALQRGELDGFALFAPTTDRAVVEGYGYYPPCCDLGEVDFGDANGGILANTAFLQDQELATNFMRAYVEALTQMATDEEAYVKLGTQVAGVSAEIAREAYKHMRFSYNIDEKAIVAAARLGPEFGFAKEDYSQRVLEVLDYSLLEKVTGKPRSELSKPAPKKS